MKTLTQTDTVKERGILFSGAMVRALLAGTKTQTRRVVKFPAKWPADFGTQVAEVYWNPKNITGWVFRTVAASPSGPGKIACPYGEAGDRLWVRETFQPIWAGEEPGDYKTGAGYNINYVATGGIMEWADEFNGDGELTSKCTPSIFMPRWASRITLEVAGVRVERLTDISIADCLAEGIQLAGRDTGDVVTAYKVLWNLINLKPSPLYERDEETGEMEVVAYRAFPWSNADFEAAYPGERASGRYRGLPLTVTENPWVWVVEFKRVEG